eukprot:RCo036402
MGGGVGEQASEATPTLEAFGEVPDEVAIVDRSFLKQCSRARINSAAETVRGENRNGGGLGGLPGVAKYHDGAMRSDEERPAASINCSAATSTALHSENHTCIFAM